LQSVKRNAISSPLLNLPRELREKIWSNLLGDQTIHITISPGPRSNRKGRRNPVQRRRKPVFRRPYAHCSFPMTYIVCEATVSEQEGYELFMNTRTTDIPEEQGGLDMRLSCNRHAKCYDYCKDFRIGRKDEQPSPRERLERNRIHIAILSVCRQAYVEVNPILWGSTTWSFTQGIEFYKFLGERTAIQRRFLRKLHLDIEKWNQHEWGSILLGQFNGITKEPILKTFRALEVLHVDIKSQDPYFTHTPFELSLKAARPYVFALQFLPLKTVTVTVMRRIFWHQLFSSSPANHYIANVDVAKWIRLTLLDYQGALFKRCQKEYQEKLKAEKLKELEQRRRMMAEKSEERQKRIAEMLKKTEERRKRIAEKMSDTNRPIKKLRIGSRKSSRLETRKDT
jgi:hypothetical protein